MSKKKEKKKKNKKALVSAVIASALSFVSCGPAIGCVYGPAPDIEEDTTVPSKIESVTEAATNAYHPEDDDVADVYGPAPDFEEEETDVDDSEEDTSVNNDIGTDAEFDVTVEEPAIIYGPAPDYED